VTEVLKRCGCGRSFTAETWAALPDAKRYTLEWGEVQEQRRCICGSHLVVCIVPEPGNAALDPDSDSK
jgi:hypothetical protein